MSEQPWMSGFYFLILQNALLASFTCISHWNEHRASAYGFLNFTYIVLSESYLDNKKILFIPDMTWQSLQCSGYTKELEELYSTNVFTFFYPYQTLAVVFSFSLLISTYPNASAAQTWMWIDKLKPENFKSSEEHAFTSPPFKSVKCFLTRLGPWKWNIFSHYVN